MITPQEVKILQAVCERIKQEAEVEFFMARQCIDELYTNEADARHIVEEFNRHHKNGENLTKKLEELNHALAIAMRK